MIYKQCVDLHHVKALFVLSRVQYCRANVWQILLLPYLNALRLRPRLFAHIFSYSRSACPTWIGNNTSTSTCTGSDGTCSRRATIPCRELGESGRGNIIQIMYSFVLVAPFSFKYMKLAYL